MRAVKWGTRGSFSGHDYLNARVRVGKAESVPLLPPLPPAQSGDWG
jgi:hypothetical protein